MANDTQLLNRLVRLREECLGIETKLAPRWPVIIGHVLKRKGLSLRAFAAKLGLSPTYLSEVATGKKPPSPRLEKLLREQMVGGPATAV